MKFGWLVFIYLIFTFCSKPESKKMISVQFVYKNQVAKSVSIAGSFNNWTADKNVFQKKENGIWELEILLEPNYYQYKLVVDGNWIPDPSHDWKINDGGDSFNSIIKVGNPATPKRKKRAIPFDKTSVPKPILPSQPDWIELYYAAWEMAWNKIGEGTSENGFAPLYMDEGFNELIYQWDLCFITGFAMYANQAFPVMPSLDNFYAKQRPDGYIQRVYWETDGTIAHEPTADEPMVNPPLFAWIEYRYVELTGDTSRLKRVIPILEKYFNWINSNCRTELGKGLYYVTPLGSGMDNTPRNGVGKAAWIDFSSQQALAAYYLAKLSKLEGKSDTEAYFANEFNRIKTTINQLLWDEKTSFYYDYREDKKLNSTKHIGAFWTLLAHVSSTNQNEKLLEHLTNPTEFWRPHPIPTLAADQPEYDPKGHYWLGSVWAPTNYMVVKGLAERGYQSLADTIAFRHLRAISTIYNHFKPDEEKIAFDERYADAYQTLWECYSSELPEPATRWDNTFYSRQDFVGWTGLGPIAMLIENKLGLKLNGLENSITWEIKEDIIMGMEHIQLGKNKVNLLFDPDKKVVTASSNEPTLLKINYKREITTKMIENKIILIKL